MNQDRDVLNGEAGDAYSGTVVLAPTVWSPPPAPQTPPRFQVLYHETFEAWPPVPTYWAFETQAAGTIGAVTSGTPHGGTQELLIRTVNDGNLRTQSAVVAVDLTGYETATDLNLDFWAKYGNYQGTLYVDLSGDGTTWQTSVWSVGPATTYTNYTLDLDALAAAKGIARDGDVYLRFRYYGSYTYSGTHDVYLDDVRVGAGDLAGPWVTGHEPTAVPSSGGPLSSIRLTFNEAIDTTTFTGVDVVVFKDPQGATLTPVTVSPVAGSGDMQFELTFTAQDLRGTYRLTVGPDIRDTSGNLMNQDKDV